MTGRTSKSVRVTVSDETYDRIGELTKALGGTRPGNVLQVAVGIGVKYLEEAIKVLPDLGVKDAKELLETRK